MIKTRHMMLLMAAAATATAQAKVELPQFFTDSMVVQQQAVLTIPGKAKKGATVKVTPSWSDQTVKAKAGKDGRFKAQIATPGAGGPYSITIDDGTPVTLNDVLVGDVWFCSGQSNMEMPVEGWGRVMDYSREVAQANSPNVRLLQVQKQTSYSPQADTKINMGGWRSANPQTVGGFSAIGYFFGREINDATDTPIGIIDCTWGGTPIEAWSAYETLKGVDEFGAELAAIEDCGFDSESLEADYARRYAKWHEVAIPDIDYAADMAKATWSDTKVPGEWEKSSLPDFDGVVWLRKAVTLTKTEADSKAELHLACIDDDDITYINGQKVGETTGYSLKRAYPIAPGILKEGENIIDVRVVDTGGGGGIWGDADDVYLQVGDRKMRLNGTWQQSVVSDFSKLDPMPISPVGPGYPTVLYNAMMHPLTVMPVKGVLWYQGCANVGRADQYSKLFKAMITDWRKDWGEPELPFYFVQLAGYLEPLRFQPDSQWAALRQAQMDALELPATGMAVAIDLGNPDDIHPKNKQEVAHRLALAALNNQYGQPHHWRAPMVKEMRVKDRYATIKFDGEVTMYGGGQGFVVKGTDGKWAQGYGRQTGPDTIEVSSDEIAQPIEVRYDWADYPEGNLRSLGGLPVAPFKAAK